MKGCLLNTDACRVHERRHLQTLGNVASFHGPCLSVHSIIGTQSNTSIFPWEGNDVPTTDIRAVTEWSVNHWGTDARKGTQMLQRMSRHFRRIQPHGALELLYGYSRFRKKKKKGVRQGQSGGNKSSNFEKKKVVLACLGAGHHEWHEVSSLSRHHHPNERKKHDLMRQWTLNVHDWHWLDTDVTWLFSASPFWLNVAISPMNTWLRLLILLFQEPQVSSLSTSSTATKISKPLRRQ